MTPRHRTRCCAVLALTLAGCSDFDLFHNKQSDEAQQRWGQARARVKLQLAEKSFANGAVEEALKQTNEVLSLDPGLADAYLLTARIRLETGEIAKALSAVEQAEAVAPASAESSYLRGLVAERRGQLAEALTCYETAYRMNREEPDYLLTYVECLIAMDQPDKALEVIAPRRLDYEQTPAVHALTGQAWSLLGRHTRAAECYQLALHLAPQDPLLREETGITFLAAGWDEEAVDTLMPLVASHPTTTQPTSGPSAPPLAALQALAAALMRIGKPQQAADVLEHNIENCDQVAAVWLLLAEAHVRAGSLDAAEQAADKAFALSPDESQGGLIRAYCALQGNRIDQAIDVAQRLVQRDPKDVEARALLAQALERIPDGSARAAEQYRQILAISPENRWARQQLQRVTQQAKAR